MKKQKVKENIIHAMAETFVSFLEKHTEINPEEREICVYGCDVALYTILSTLGLLLIGCLCGMLMETIICISIFYINQSNGGGYHASTHFRCFITMTIGLLFYSSFFCFHLPIILIEIMGFASLCGLLCMPIVLHENKKYLLSQKTKLTKCAKSLILVQMVLYIGVIFWSSHSFIQAFSFSFVICLISRTAAFMLQRVTISLKKSR